MPIFGHKPQSTKGWQPPDGGRAPSGYSSSNQAKILQGSPNGVDIRLQRRSCRRGRRRCRNRRLRDRGSTVEPYSTTRLMLNNIAVDVRRGNA